MTPLRIASAAVLLILAGAAFSGCSTPNRVEKPGYAVLKVNHDLLDLDGHETDIVGDLKQQAIYQYHLRHTPAHQTGERFKVKWKAPPEVGPVQVRLDVRGLNAGNETTFDNDTITYDTNENWAEWTIFDIAGDRFRKLGRVQSWKVTLSAGGQVKAELPSANWYGDIKP
ncbi:MAG: hypothetical protein JO317_09010 [Verrucomicrobiae bacterium]|nr:hypothetical protein [Verrucomicrobiae bacterium]